MRHVAGVRQKLLQTLQAETRSRWLPDAEDGALNPRALHRLATARFVRDDPATADALAGKVFRRKAVTRRLKFDPLRHERFKDFDEPFRKTSGRFDGLSTHAMTPLGESLLFAARLLAKRPEPRKALLCLTDGRPCVGIGNETTTFNHAKDAIRRIERAGIDAALVGIQESCVHGLHHRAVVVNQLDDLPRTVMAQLHTLLSRETRAAFPRRRAVFHNARPSPSACA